MGDRFVVNADELRAAGRGLVDTADQAHQQVRAHSGAQDGDTAANTSFAVAQALGQCESSWEEVLTSVSTALAVAGDTLELNAATYSAAETAAHDLLTPR